MKVKDSVSLKGFLAMLIAFAVLQALFLLQMNYTVLRQSPSQCDCQCNKQLHISASDLNEDDSKKENAQQRSAVRFRTNEKQLKKLLDAEDRRFDKNLSLLKNRTIADPDEKNPYTDDKFGKPVIRHNSHLIPSPMNLNPLIDESKMRCKGNNSNLILIYVYSAPKNLYERQRVRNTWGSVKEHLGKKFRTIFFIGDVTKDKLSLMPRLINESKSHGDVVQDVSYIDAYRNLTLKGISALRWVNKFCPQTYRVMKVDDDTMLNPYNLVEFLHGQTDITMSETICKVTHDVGPIRNPRSKYYVSYKEYPDDYYPSYCQGYGYIFPPSVIPSLVDAFDKKKTEPITMEDVFITGITGSYTGMRLHALMPDFSTICTKFETYLQRITTRPELFIVGHVHNNRYADVFWHLIQHRQRDKKLQIA